MPGNSVNNVNLSWKTVKNTVAERMINNSLSHTLNERKILLRTKLINNELRKYSHFKSYAHYVKVKNSILKNLPIDQDDDSEVSFATNNHNSCRESSIVSSDLSCSDDDDIEDDSPKENSIIDEHLPSTSGISNAKNTRKRPIETPNSLSASNSNDCRRSTRSLNKKTTTQSKLTSFLKKKPISHDEKSPLRDKDKSKESGNVSKSTGRKSRKSSTENSQLPSTSNGETGGKEDDNKAGTSKPRNKTREDVKKNLSSIISYVETRDVTEENGDKINFHDSHYDSELNLSNVMAVAQSTQYPDDSSDESEDKNNSSNNSNPSFLYGYNENRQNGEKIADSNSSGSETLKCSDIEQNPKRENKPLKITNTQIVNNRVKIVGKNQVFGNFDKTERFDKTKDVANDISGKKKRLSNSFTDNQSENKNASESGKSPKQTPKKTTETDSKLKKMSSEELKRQNAEDQEKPESTKKRKEKESKNKRETESKELTTDDERQRKTKEKEIKQFTEEEESGSGEDIEKIKKFIIRKSATKKTPRKEKSGQICASAKKLEKEVTDKNRQTSESDKENVPKLECLTEKSEQQTQKIFSDNDSFEEIESEGEKEKITQKYVKPSEADKRKSKEDEKTRENSTSEKENSIIDEEDKTDFKKRKFDEETSENSSSEEEGNLIIDETITDENGSNENDKEGTGKGKSVEENSENSSSEEEENLIIDKKEKSVEKISRDSNSKEYNLTAHSQFIGKNESNESSSDEEKDEEEERQKEEKQIRQKSVEKNSEDSSSEEEDNLMINKQKEKKSRNASSEKYNNFTNYSQFIDKNESSENSSDEEDKEEKQKKEAQRKQKFVEKNPEEVERNSKSKKCNLTGYSHFIGQNETDESNSDEEKENTVHEVQSQDMMASQNTADEFPSQSREILTQFKERANSFSEDDEEMRLTLENEQNDNTYVNLDDNKITIEEHKIDIPENYAEDTEIMSAESLKCINQRKRLVLNNLCESSSSDEEIVKTVKNKKQMTKESESDSENERKTSPKKRKKKKSEESPKKEKSEDSIKSESDEDNRKSKKKKKKSTEKEVVEEKSLKSPEKRKISKENSVPNEIHEGEEEEVEEDNKKEEFDQNREESDQVKKLDESKELKQKKKEKKKILDENTPKKKNSKNSGEVFEESANPSQTGINGFEGTNPSGEDDSDFESYIKDGISYFKRKEETPSSKKQKKSKKEEKGKNETQEESENVASKKNESEDQIIDDALSQSFVGPSQIISEVDPVAEDGKKLNKKKNEAESLNYVLSNLKKKSNRSSGNIDEENKNDSVNTKEDHVENHVEDFKPITNLDDLVEKENLVECDMPLFLSINEVLEDEEVWVFEFPKKENLTDWVGKKFSLNGTELKVGNNKYHANCKKIDTLTSVLGSKKTNTRYKPVHFRPTYSIYFRSENSLTNSIDEDKSMKMNSESSRNKEIIKKKKKKHSSKESSMKTEISEIKKNNTSQNNGKTLHSERKRRHSPVSSENEDSKNDSKANIKRKRLLSINGFALDEKPPVVPLKNSIDQKYNTDNSDVEITDGESKPKKEKLEIPKKSPLVITKTKPKMKTSPKKERDEKNLKSPVTMKKSINSEAVENKTGNKKEDVKRRKSISWNVENVFDIKAEKTDMAEISKKLKKKAKEHREHLSNISQEFQPRKKNESYTTDSSDLEVKDTKKREKKLKKKRLAEILNPTADSSDDVKPKEEKPKKKTAKLIDFDH